MKIAIKEILESHFDKTGEHITQTMIAREMVNEGIFKNLHSARNMLQYNISGKAKSLDIEMLEFLKRKFNLTLNEIIA